MNFFYQFPSIPLVGAINLSPNVGGLLHFNCLNVEQLSLMIKVPFLHLWNRSIDLFLIGCSFVICAICQLLSVCLHLIEFDQ